MTVRELDPFQSSVNQYPFKASIDCGLWNKIFKIVTSIFHKFCHILRADRVFCCIISWMYADENLTTDKVDEVVKKKQYSPPSHPAAQPPESDLISALPDEMLLKIFGYLDETSLMNIGLVSKNFFAISEEIWRSPVEQRLGSFLSAEFKKSRESWRDVMLDLNRPFVKVSNTFFRRGQDKGGWEKKPELKAVCECVSNKDLKALQQALIKLEAVNKCDQLNSRFFGMTPLEIAAVHGNIAQARLLIQYGAMDGVVRVRYDLGVKGKSALFYAAQNEKVEMVNFLLENGAFPNQTLEEYGYTTPLLECLLRNHKRQNTDFLECLLLLMNAWKEEVGEEIVCKKEYITKACIMAIIDGNANLANFLFALGIRVQLSHKNAFNSVYEAIISKNLEMINFLHRWELIDFKNVRVNVGGSLLHVAVALGANEILQYFITQVKIPVDICNVKGETYIVSGKRELEQNVLRAIKYELETFRGFKDETSGFLAKSLDECLKHKVDLNLPINDNGQTLLHIAVESILNHHRNSENGTIRLLLENGANPLIEDNEGLSPLKKALSVISKAKEDHLCRFNKENMIRAECLVMEMQKYN